MKYDDIQQQDPEVFDLIRKEEQRQKLGIELIPSENYASEAVLEASGSIFTDKYAENYPGRRYYGGCVNVDALERLCQKRALSVFGATDYYVNVQPYSGSPANLAAYLGVAEIGDTIMALRLDHGGHLTHGSPVSLSGRAFNFVHYQLDAKKEVLDYDEIERLAQEHKPKILVCGYTAYPRLIDFQRLHDIAKSVGAISMADISHISGLIIGGMHPSPFPFTDIVTTTTHKTLRGPRGAIIFCKPEFKDGIEKAVFPGMQGGPHEHTIAAIAVALQEATQPEFKAYAKQIVKNAQALAASLQAGGLRLISGGTDNHLILLDLRPFGPGRGMFIEKALEAAGISTNKSPLPNDPAPPYYPSGVRLGSPAVTTRGMKETEMRQIGEWVVQITKAFVGNELPDDKAQRLQVIKDFKAKLLDDALIKDIKTKVENLASQFPLPGLQ